MDFRQFSYKEGNFKIVSRYFDEICNEIIEQRNKLEAFISNIPSFSSSLTPLRKQLLKTLSPIPIAQKMIEASNKTGTGPMAAVAGAFAQTAAEKGLSSGDSFVVIENGGDMFIAGNGDLNIGIYAPPSPLSGKTAFHITGEMLPLGICSSSSTMGHSLSLGKCDLATVFSADAALADAAATLAGNMVKTEKDLQQTAEHIADIDGIQGVLLILKDKVALAGKVPQLVKMEEADLSTKVTRDIFSNGI